MQMARLQKKSVLGFIAGIFGAAFGPRVANPKTLKTLISQQALNEWACDSQTA
jgi:hypothetical protein